MENCEEKEEAISIKKRTTMDKATSTKEGQRAPDFICNIKGHVLSLTSRHQICANCGKYVRLSWTRGNYRWVV